MTAFKTQFSHLPFGEDLLRSLSGVGKWSLSGAEGWSLSGAEGHQQNTAAYLSPYTFSGKEKDVEIRSIREDLQKASTEWHSCSCFGSEMLYTPKVARELVRSFTSDRETQLFN